MYWLFKTEPDAYSIEDLAAEHSATTRWDGIRNFQARNFIRDKLCKGDEVLIYHSSCKPTAIVGTAKVVSNPYPDPSQFDQQSTYFDGKSSTANPRWFSVDITLQKRFQKPLPLAQLKATEKLSGMVLLKQGRLSIQPVTPEEFNAIMALSSR